MTQLTVTYYLNIKQRKCIDFRLETLSIIRVLKSDRSLETILEVFFRIDFWDLLISQLVKIICNNLYVKVPRVWMIIQIWEAIFKLTMSKGFAIA